MDDLGPIACPNCEAEVMMHEFTYEEMLAKWQGREDVAVIPHVRCPECKASYWRSAIEEMLEN